MGIEGQVRGCGGLGVAERLGTGAGSRGQALAGCWAPSCDAAGAVLDPCRAPELHQPRTHRHSPKRRALRPQAPSTVSPRAELDVPKHGWSRAASNRASPSPESPGTEPGIPQPCDPPSSASPSPKPHVPKPGVPKHQARCPEQVFCPQTPRPWPQHQRTLGRGQLRAVSPHCGHQHGVDTGCGDPLGATPRPLRPRSPSRGAGTHQDGGRRWEPAAL